MWAWTGTSDPSGFWYLLWSGPGSILERLLELVTIGAILLRKHNCETQGCWRLGRHEWPDPSTGQSHRLCRHCHPLGPLTRSGVQGTHDEYASYPLAGSADDPTYPAQS